MSKSKVYLLSFSTLDYANSQKKLELSALKHKVDTIISVNQDAIRRTDFYKSNKSILMQNRGAGFWLWKPYLILKSLRSIKEGDVLIYADSGVEIISSVSPLIKILNINPILLFQDSGDSTNSQYTKGDCFALMNCDKEIYYNSRPVQASFQIYRNVESSRRFVTEWLAYCQNANIITDYQNIWQNNKKDFIDHRHDQSVLSLLAIKYNIELFRDPSQWGNHQKIAKYQVPGEFLYKKYENPKLNSPYPTILNHHRIKSRSIVSTLLQKLFK